MSLDKKSPSKLLNCGFVSGLVQAVVFNPWDRALYLSVVNHKPFLDVSNFRKPFEGVSQTIVQRAISSGLYFPLEEIYLDHFQNTLQPATGISRPWLLFLAGTMAGATNGLLTNPLSTIKYHTWGKAQFVGNTESFFVVGKEMMMRGGFEPFFVGTIATMLRDVVFGGCFALGRHQWKEAADNKNVLSATVINVIVGCMATMASSPLNYVRNIHYSTPVGVKPSGIMSVLWHLAIETSRQKTMFEKCRFIQMRLRIGWGTARVGFGMAFVSQLYDLCSAANR